MRSHFHDRLPGQAGAIPHALGAIPESVGGAGKQTNPPTLRHAKYPQTAHMVGHPADGTAETRRTA